MTKHVSITTTLPYVNADPHLGFALEIVTADAIARHHRLVGDKVFFSTGTDEHGQKLFDAAEKAGTNVQDYVDHFAAEFHKLKEGLNLSNDTFIRTTDPHHIAAAEEMWRRCDQSGDIYKKAYEGLYCVGCERFLTEKDIEGGKCIIHGKEPILLKEENYFFRFSKYADALLEYLGRPDVVLPDWRREEAINFVKEGLEDFSISREAKRLSWGIPVPGDETQVMYVWFDALTNYISTLGWPDDPDGNFKRFWEEGESIQFAGKDQVRFQSLMWQAMLFSAGIMNTDRVIYHGFITSGGQKMSKSIGNVINPLTVVNEYGTDATRYFLLRHVHPFEDTDVTMERIKEIYNANLANGLGNLVSRVMQMAITYLDGPVKLPGKPEVDSDVQDYIEKFELNRAMDVIWERIGHDDVLIAQKKPFASVKSENVGERAEAIAIIEKLVRELFFIATELEPFMPETAEKIKIAVKEHKKPENLFARKD